MRKFAVIAIVAAAFIATAAADTVPQPYLAAGNEPDASKFLQAPPSQNEVSVYEATRKLETSKDPGDKARWAMATSDDNYKTPAMLADFSCAIGTNLTPANAPHLATIYDRAQKDAEVVSGAAKKVFNRPRPLTGRHMLHLLSGGMIPPERPDSVC